MLSSIRIAPLALPFVAAINFNEDSIGGSVIEANLIFNMCRESGDHGVSRVPIVAAAQARFSLTPASHARSFPCTRDSTVHTALQLLGSHPVPPQRRPNRPPDDAEAMGHDSWKLLRCQLQLYGCARCVRFWQGIQFLCAFCTDATHAQTMTMHRPTTTAQTTFLATRLLASSPISEVTITITRTLFTRTSAIHRGLMARR
jgi:hypothetical protein